MKRLATLCMGALLLSTTLGVAGLAHAQDQTTTPAGAASGPFADVPTDHWAYQAVDTLQKAGIVIGYPDGTYGGRRAMTRYEFAVAIARLLPLINTNAASKSDLSALQQEMESRLDQNQQALDALRSLVDEFQPELQQLGQDVAAIKARLDALEQRVAVVEAEQRRVKITGDLNFVAQGFVNTSGTETAPLDQDGYRAGSAGAASYTFWVTDGGTTGTGGTGGTGTVRRGHFYPPYSGANIGDETTVPSGNTSLWNDVDFYNDVLLTIDGRVSDNAHAIVKLEGGDMAPFLGSLTSIDPYRENGFDSAANEGTWVNVYEAYLDMPVSLGPLSGAEVEIGRFGNQFTKYTLKAINPDWYVVLPETSTGDYPMDGGKLTFSAGPAHVQLYAAKDELQDVQSGSGDYVSMVAGPSVSAYNGPYRPGSVYPGGINYLYNYDSVGDTAEYSIDQSAGARITVGNPSNWEVGLTGILARVDDNGDTVDQPIDPHTLNPYSNLGIYGVDLAGVIPVLFKGGITLNASGNESQTGIYSNWGNVNSNGANQAWEATLGAAFGPFSIKGGYQVVYPNFSAPGDWGHYGTWINPTNVKGGIVSASLVLTPRLTLAANGNFYQGAETLPVNIVDGSANIQSPLENTGDRLDHYDVGLKYGLTSQYNVDLGYEWDQWELNNNNGFLANSGKPTEQYITIGVGHSFNRNASLKLLYQILEYNDNGTGFDPYSEGPGLNGKENGGVAITQFSLKF